MGGDAEGPRQACPRAWAHPTHEAPRKDALVYSRQVSSPAGNTLAHPWAQGDFPQASRAPLPTEASVTTSLVYSSSLVRSRIFKLSSSQGEQAMLRPPVLG